ncbi:MAG: hypothetical protein K2W95_17245 [Candidatus Obscuribacterales bacterium]|nr:hypothetical protein [Candidatus Obscuribacterales bacterium]
MSETRELYIDEKDSDEEPEQSSAGVEGLFAEVASTGYRAALAYLAPDAESPYLCSSESPESKDSVEKEGGEKTEPTSELEKSIQADIELQSVGYQLQAGLKVLQDQLDNKIPSPDRTGQPALAEQIKALNKEIAEIQKKVNPRASADEKFDIAKGLQKATMQVLRIQYGLPPGTEDDVIREEVRKDEAKKNGLASDATWKQIDEAQQKRELERSAKLFGVDPKTATQKDIDEAIKKLDFERECREYGLDPKKATKELVEEAKEQREFEKMCADLKLDPKQTTREEAKKAHEKYWHEKDCESLGLDPKTTTKEQATKVRSFNGWCDILGIDKNDKDAPQKIHARRCQSRGLPASTTPDELDRIVEEEFKKEDEIRRKYGR